MRAFNEAMCYINDASIIVYAFPLFKSSCKFDAFVWKYSLDNTN